MVTDLRPTPDRIALIGIGGTGCALLPLLAGMAFSRITLVDGDTVEAANLPRQPLYGPADVGRLKVTVAAEHLRRIAPHSEVVAVPHFVDAANIRSLLADQDLVADCTDDLNARSLIDGVCAELRLALVTGAVHGPQVQVASLHVNDSVSLRSFFPARGGADQDGCDMRRVPASVTTFAAAVMAEHVAALLRGDASRAGILELVDTYTGTWLRIAPPDPLPAHANRGQLHSTTA